MFIISKPTKKTVIGFIISYLISAIPVILKLCNIINWEWFTVFILAIMITIILIISIFIEPFLQFIFCTVGAIYDCFEDDKNRKR